MTSPKKIINSVGVNNEKKLVSSLFHKHNKKIKAIDIQIVLIKIFQVEL